VGNQTGLYKEESLREWQPGPWAGDFRVDCGVCPPYPVTGRDWGLLGELVGRVYFDMLNRHLGDRSWVWNLTQMTVKIVGSAAGAVVVHAFDPSTWEAEAEAGGFLSSRPAWSTEWVPGQPGLHRETLSRKTEEKKKKKKSLTSVGCLLTFVIFGYQESNQGLVYPSKFLLSLNYVATPFYFLRQVLINLPRLPLNSQSFCPSL
jgi:hypothetical protein